MYYCDNLYICYLQLLLLLHELLLLLMMMMIMIMLQLLLRTTTIRDERNPTNSRCGALLK
jgi:hypothetical protein